jgi:hypothetical protein
MQYIWGLSKASSNIFVMVMNDAHHKAKNIDLWGSLQLININHTIPAILLYQVNMKITMGYESKGKK